MKFIAHGSEVQPAKWCQFGNFKKNQMVMSIKVEYSKDRTEVSNTLEFLKLDFF